MSVWKINNKTVLPVKQSHYTLESLLRNKKLAEQYNCQAIFVTDDKLIYSTDSIKKHITLTDDSYTLAD